MTEGITYLIKNDSGVQALLGQNKAESKYKVYPGICDQPEQWPYTVVKVFSKEPIPCKGQSPTTFKYGFVVITYHLSYLTCQQIDKAIFWAIDNKAQGTYNGVTFKSIIFETLKDDQINTGSNLLHAKVSTYNAIVNEDQAT